MWRSLPHDTLLSDINNNKKAELIKVSPFDNSAVFIQLKDYALLPPEIVALSGYSNFIRKE
jgi:hypothetical protein